MSQLQCSQTVYPGGIAHRVCFDEEEDQKEIALPLTHRPHMVQAKLLAPSFFSKSRPPVASRLSISYIKHNKHTLMFAQRWTQILPLFLTLCLKHTHIFAVTKSHRVCGQILCEERALTDVEAAARSRRNGERGSVGKKGRGEGVASAGLDPLQRSSCLRIREGVKDVRL